MNRVSSYTNMYVQSTSDKYVNKHHSQIKIQSNEDVVIKRKITQLEKREQSIINHEKMHMLIGGSLASSPTYTYSIGPDGKKYVSGGRVDMKMPTGGSLESLLSGLKRIKAAASSVTNPSAADLSTAAMAASIEASVNSEIALIKMKESYSKSDEKTQGNKSNLLKPLIDKIIESTYTTKISQMKYRTFSKFDLLI